MHLGIVLKSIMKAMLIFRSLFVFVIKVKGKNKQLNKNYHKRIQEKFVKIQKETICPMHKHLDIKNRNMF